VCDRDLTGIFLNTTTNDDSNYNVVVKIEHRGMRREEEESKR
jgi:hypothetical protein